MQRLSILLLAGLASAGFAQEPAPATDPLTVVVPGKRAGPVTGYSSLSILKGLFGRTKVKTGKLPGDEGETIDGAVINAGTDRELHVVWEPSAVERRIKLVRVIGRAWKFENGLAIGLTVGELEKINGQPFKMNGFNWDFGGYASFDGGALASGVSVRLKPTAGNCSPDITGNKQVPSTSTALLAAHPLVSAIAVTFRNRP